MFSEVTSEHGPHGAASSPARARHAPAPTRSENRLWAWLRDRRFEGYKFRRQFPIDGYVLDFYCAELKLAIEADGRQHGQILMAQYDDQRLLALQERGIEVLRIPNELLIRDSPMVETIIRHAIEQRRAR